MKLTNVKTWKAKREEGICTFVLLGDYVVVDSRYNTQVRRCKRFIASAM